MAGYIMTLDSYEALLQCVKTGIYSTKMSQPKGSWLTHHEGTFADYLSMKPGDNIYFFIKRKIYGIGVLTNAGPDCKYLSYMDSLEPKTVQEDKFKVCEPMFEYITPDNRCFCTFKPHPYFFTVGVDMDEALNSNPSKFRMLRAMWKVSFIKIDDEENKALFDIILKRNEQNLLCQQNILEFSDSELKKIEHKKSTEYRLNAYKLLLSAANADKIKHEMAIEAALCETLIKDNDTPMGKWDYISHQVVASPFKPIDYMDKMDIFGYRYIPGYSTISKYLVIEIKRDAAGIDVIGQIMKYVDWINSEYAHGDYSMIEAYVVAADFPQEVIDERDKVCKRTYLSGLRPAVSNEWTNVKLLKYSYENSKLIFNEV